MKKIIKKVHSILRKTALRLHKKDDDALRWGIVGTGYMAHTFSNVITNSNCDIVSAVVSRSVDKARKFAKEYNAKHIYDSLSKFVAEGKFDVVYIATPVESHYNDIRECLEAGRNVLCEKPIVLKKSQLLHLSSIAKQNRCFLMEAMWMRCLPTFQLADKWIECGKIGNIIGVRANLFKMESTSAGNNIKGVLENYGEYAIAFALKYLKEPTIESFVRLNRMSDVDADWQIVLKSSDSIGIINLSSRFCSNSNAAVIGTEGVIEWNSQFNRTNCVTLYDNYGNIIKTKLFRYRNEGFEYQLEEVNKCVREGKTESLMVPLEVSLAAVGLMDELLS